MRQGVALKFGMVGCGKIAQRHARLIRQHGELAAVCDIHTGRMESMRSEYGVKGFSDISEMCKEVRPDVLVVCTPNGLHASHTITGFHYGSHVICEKPMALNAADGERMIAAANAAQKKLFIVKQNRYNPPVVTLAKILDEGLLGKLSHIQLNCAWNRDAEYYNDCWHGTADMDGGILFTQFSHFIDIVGWLFGDLDDVRGMASNQFHKKSIEFSDTVIAAARFKNGLMGSLNFTINAFETNMEGSITVFGEKGTVKIGGQYLNLLEYHQVANRNRENVPIGGGPNHYGHYEGSMSNHHIFYQNVTDVLNGEGEMDTTPQDGLQTISMIEKIYAQVKS